MTLQTAQHGKGNLLPIQFHPELIGELSTRLYSDQFAPIRELVSNAWDEDARRVDITLRQGSMTFQDDGNGIEDPRKFLTKGDPSKKEKVYSKVYRRRLVGQKGLGVLSAFMIGNKCEILTRSGRDVAHRIILDEGRMLSDLTALWVPLENPSELGIAHGTTFKITGLKKLYSGEGIMEYLSVAFRPQLGKEFRIRINGKVVRARKLPKGKVYSRRVKVGKGTIRVQLVDPEKSDEREAVLHYNPVMVKSVRLQERPHLTGYIQTDFLQVKTDRSDFIRDEAYERFDRELRAFVKKIPPSTEMAGKRLLKSLRRISRLLVGVVKDIGLSTVDARPLPAGSTQIRLSRSEQSGRRGRVKVTTRPGSPVGRRIRVKFYSLSPRLASRLPGNVAKGVNIECHKLSPTEPPVQRTSGNTIIINLAFPHIESLLKLPEEGREFALIPYVARGYSDFVARDSAELIRVTDQVTAELTNRYLRAN